MVQHMISAYLSILRMLMDGLFGTQVLVVKVHRREEYEPSQLFWVTTASCEGIIQWLSAFLNGDKMGNGEALKVACGIACMVR